MDNANKVFWTYIIFLIVSLVFYTFWYSTGTQGLIFVVDSSDRDRIDEARSELHKIVSDREMKDAMVLVFANKQDIPGAMKPQEISERLGLPVIRDRKWFVQPSCATTGEGLIEGLTWMTDNKD